VPKAENPTLGVVMPNLGNLGAVIPKLEELKNRTLVSPRLEGDSSSDSVSWGVRLDTMNLYGS
jgi:hypothetical protein